MAFLYPGFLFALAALAIPVIIHLFNFRRFKKIPFTNVRFLREIKQQTQSQNKLRHLLVLLMRLLALTFLVFAFAQPFIPSGDAEVTSARKSVSVFVDNSFSMEGESEAGMMLDVAKNRAIDVAMAYAPADRFQLLSQDFEGKHQRFVGRPEFIEWVQELEISPQSRSLVEITTRQDDQLKSGEADLTKMAYIISDFQKSRYDLENFVGDTAVNLSLIHLERNSPNNLYIDSVWFSSPVRKLGEAEQLSVRVVNRGENAVENVPIKILINGKQKAIGTFAAEAGTSVETPLYFVNEESGLQRAQVQLEDYPVTYDDAYYFSYPVFEQIDILSIRSSSATTGDFLRSVYAGDSTYSYESVPENRIDYSTLNQKDLVILFEVQDIPSGLSGELSSFVNNGGSVWLIPSAEANLNSYNSFLESLNAGGLLNALEGDYKVRTLNAEHPLYRGVFEKLPDNPDLPTTSRYFRYAKPLRSEADVLMGFPNGDGFLMGYRPGQGQFYALSVPLSGDNNNFVRHALFVTTALRMAELSQTTGLNAIPLGPDALFTIPPVTSSNEAVFRLISEDGTVDVIPRHQLRDGRLDITPGPEVRTAGNYLLLLGNDTLAAAGLNYTREESDLASFTSDEIEDVTGRNPQAGFRIFDGNSAQLVREISQQSKGKELWRICLILVLVFLLLESLLLRFWKKQGV